MGMNTYITGYGCVSAAGIGAKKLYDACVHSKQPVLEKRERARGDSVIHSYVRPVDLVALKAAMPKHPRFRRASAISKYAITAVHEAMGDERIKRVQEKELKLGIVMVFKNGCVNYSNRFFSEVIDNPSLASPIIFPETVYNAPAGHIAGYLNADGPTYTLIGDSAGWFSAFRVAEDWMDSGLVDACLVISAEELDWIVTEAYTLYNKELYGTEGAAAVYLEKSNQGVEIEELSSPQNYYDRESRKEALTSLAPYFKYSEETILIDGGARLSPAKCVGASGGLASAYQTIIALQAIRGKHDSAYILAAGSNQNAYMVKLKSNII